MATRFNVIATLVVDDSEMECHLLRAQLGQFAWVKVLDSVHDGLEAIAYVRRTNPFTGLQTSLYPDLILLDFKMPRCDGMEVLKFLRHQLCRPKVVLWSSDVEQINIPLAMELGADVVCPKPKGLADLAAIFERLGTQLPQPRRLAPRGAAANAEPMHA
jgi:CheY-like chemotaxis protein